VSRTSRAPTGAAMRSGLATTNNVATVRRTAVSLVRWGSQFPMGAT
jgi:hypothetical protein